MRRATIRSEVAAPDLVAAAIRPDNTPQMDTRVEEGTVVTTIERPSTSGLRSTVDDYVVNLTVATEVVQRTTDQDNTNHE
jgi:hypothetical protein